MDSERSSDVSRRRRLERVRLVVGSVSSMVVGVRGILWKSVGGEEESGVMAHPAIFSWPPVSVNTFRCIKGKMLAAVSDVGDQSLPG